MHENDTGVELKFKKYLLLDLMMKIKSSDGLLNDEEIKNKNLTSFYITSEELNDETFQHLDLFINDIDKYVNEFIDLDNEIKPHDDFKGWEFDNYEDYLRFVATEINSTNRKFMMGLLGIELKDYIKLLVKNRKLKSKNYLIQLIIYLLISNKD